MLTSLISLYIISLPESIINRRNSEETIKRERSKILISIIQNDDPEIQTMSMNILRHTYPQMDSILTSLENHLLKRSMSDAVAKINTEIMILQQKRNALYDDYELMADISQKEIISNNIAILDIQIKQEQSSLSLYQQK